MAYKQYILVCGGTACESNKGDAIFNNFKKELIDNKLSEEIQVVKTGCFGFCEKGPIVKVLPDESFYVNVTPDDAAEIVSEHIVKGRPVKRLLYDKNQSKTRTKINDLDFYQKQLRIVLRNCGIIDPENINEYIARDGYAADRKSVV